MVSKSSIRRGDSTFSIEEVNFGGPSVDATNVVSLSSTLAALAEGHP